MELNKHIDQINQQIESTRDYLLRKDIYKDFTTSSDERKYSFMIKHCVNLIYNDNPETIELLKRYGLYKKSRDLFRSHQEIIQSIKSINNPKSFTIDYVFILGMFQCYISFVFHKSMFKNYIKDGDLDNTLNNLRIKVNKEPEFIDQFHGGDITMKGMFDIFDKHFGFSFKKNDPRANFKRMINYPDKLPFTLLYFHHKKMNEDKFNSNNDKGEFDYFMYQITNELRIRPYKFNEDQLLDDKPESSYPTPKSYVNIQFKKYLGVN